MLTRVLLVEPETATRAVLRQSVQEIADVDGQGRFSTARLRLVGTPFDFLVTNLRLGAYNGLHLVYLASSAGHSARCIVYGDRHDVGLRARSAAGRSLLRNARLPPGHSDGVSSGRAPRSETAVILPLQTADRPFGAGAGAGINTSLTFRSDAVASGYSATPNDALREREAEACLARPPGTLRAKAMSMRASSMAGRLGTNLASSRTISSVSVV